LPHFLSNTVVWTLLNDGRRTTRRHGTRLWFYVSPPAGQSQVADTRIKKIAVQSN
jgi:hypothetical protein